MGIMSSYPKNIFKKDGNEMTDFTRKSFNQPDETQKFPLAKVDILSLANWNVFRYTLEP